MRNTRGLSPKDKIEFYVIRIPESTCWYWTGSLKNNGYGAICIDGKSRRAHHASYREYVGEIPSGMELHHICTERSCVNPDHLVALTHKDHGKFTRCRSSKLTKCANGHNFDGISGKQRTCSICRNAAGRRYTARHKNLISDKKRQRKANLAKAA